MSAALAWLLAAGCDEEAGAGAADGGVVIDSAAPDAGTPDAGPPEGDSTDMGPRAATLTEAGRWALRIDFVDVGVALGFQLALAIDAEAPAIASATLRIVDQDGTVSGDLATLADLAIDGDDGFVADFVGVTLPGDFSPTGTDIMATLRLEGQIRRSTFLCRAVTGRIETLMLDVERSTFGAIPRMTGPIPRACDDEPTGATRPARARLRRGFSDRPHRLAAGPPPPLRAPDAHPRTR